MNEIIGIILATIICWLNFVIIDVYFGLPEQPGVKGARLVGEAIKKRNGDIAGGFFQGNVLCSPDASAGTLLAAIGFLVLGIPGGIIAALFVFIGNRLCADPGYAGTIGCLTATMLIFIFSSSNISTLSFIHLTLAMSYLIYCYSFTCILAFFLSNWFYYSFLT